MSSNFYTNSYQKNNEELKAEQEKETVKFNEILELLTEMLKELKELVSRIEKI